jgi:hypothetical protein
MTKPEKTTAKNSNEPVLEEAPQKDARVEFEQRFGFFMNQFRAACEEAGAPIAIAIVVDAKNPDTPFIYNHGHIYDQATILAKILRNMKNTIIEDISA